MVESEFIVIKILSACRCGDTGGFIGCFQWKLIIPDHKPVWLSNQTIHSIVVCQDGDIVTETHDHRTF
jgi:hypothetical protein